MRRARAPARPPSACRERCAGGGRSESPAFPSLRDILARTAYHGGACRGAGSALRAETWSRGPSRPSESPVRVARSARPVAGRARAVRWDPADARPRARRRVWCLVVALFGIALPMLLPI